MATAFGKLKSLNSNIVDTSQFAMTCVDVRFDDNDKHKLLLCVVKKAAPTSDAENAVCKKYAQGVGLPIC